MHLQSTELTFCAVLPLPAVLNHKDEKNLCDDPAFAAPVGAILGLRGDMGCVTPSTPSVSTWGIERERLRLDAFPPLSTITKSFDFQYVIRI